MASPTQSPNPETRAVPVPQYACRSLKDLKLVNGSAPSYSSFENFEKPEGQSKVFAYSGDGALFAASFPEEVYVYKTSDGSVLCKIPVKNAIDLALSSKGTYLQTWERYSKPEDGSQLKNAKIWAIPTAEELTAFTARSSDNWQYQFTFNEAFALKLVTNEVQIFDSKSLSSAPVNRIKLEGVNAFSVSPGHHDFVALFVPEKKGAPGIVKIFSVTSTAASSASKTFFKADRVQMKWNSIGTNLLFLTTADVDKTNQSYYGQTNLYLMNAFGGFDARVALDKEGGIHDFNWSPNDKEFIVVYGFMPAKTCLMDHRANVIHDFGSLPRNFVSFNPQGRLILIAGFGNLSGTVDIWDRKTLKKMSTIEAPNSSNCEWSADGRYILCSTLSPRLRVDNGVRIFHFTGGLMHVESIEELYQVAWKPSSAEHHPFRTAFSPAPQPSPSVLTAAPVKPAASGGAYRPPGARGTATPTLFKREDEGGKPYVPPGGRNGDGGRQSQSLSQYQASPKRPRQVPGAVTANGADGSHSPSRKEPPARTAGDKPKKGGPKKKKGGKAEDATPSLTPTASGAATPLEKEKEEVKPAAAPAVEQQEDKGELSADDKKRRNLMKKLNAISLLKARKAQGETLELTQLKKIESEPEVLRELAVLDKKA